MKPSKRDVCRALLTRGSVFIHLDPRKGRPLIPARLRSQPQVVLQVGFNMPVPIPDLCVDEQSVSGTLSFKGVSFLCNIPWESVFALVGEDATGMVWEEDMPAEILAEVSRESQREPAEVVQFNTARPRKTSSARVTAPKGKSRAHLKLVR